MNKIYLLNFFIVSYLNKDINKYISWDCPWTLILLPPLLLWEQVCAIIHSKNHKVRNSDLKISIASWKYTMCKDFIKQTPLECVGFFVIVFIRYFTAVQSSSFSGSLHKQDCFASWVQHGKHISLETMKWKQISPLECLLSRHFTVLGVRA